MKNILLISSFCMLCIGFSSCSNENDEFVQDNKEMNTRSVKAIHTFPNVSRIKTDPDVVKKMNEAWEEMKNYAANPTSTFPPQNFPVIQHLQFLHIYCGYYKFSNSTELG